LNVNLNPPRKFPVRWTLCASAILLVSLCARGQSPTPAATPALTGTAPASPAPAPVATPAASATPVSFPAPSPTASPTPSLVKKVGVKIMFIPPPMDGTISLGIYDKNGRLIRVLHKAATADEFVAALDGFITHWDGLDDAGKAMPPGEYFARGYMVGDVKVQFAHAVLVTGTTRTSPDPGAARSGTATLPILGARDVQLPDGKPYVPPKQIRVSLVDNPLDRDRAGGADLTVGLHADGVWLELSDGLPLMQISSAPSAPGNGDSALISRSAPGQPLMVMVVTGSGALQTYTLTNISDMMAFDCGSFDFAGVGKW